MDAAALVGVSAYRNSRDGRRGYFFGARSPAQPWCRYAWGRQQQNEKTRLPVAYARNGGTFRL